MSVAGIGDVNADGVPDFAAATTTNTNPSLTYTRVYSGATCGLLYSLPWVGDGQNTISKLGDTNGDMNADFLLGSQLESNAVGTVRLISGVNGLTIYSVVGDMANDRFGRKVEALGDVTGDMIPDFTVGTDKFSAYVRLFSGANGAVINTIFSNPGFDEDFGAALAGITDINQDGVTDFVVGAPRLGLNIGGVHVYSFPNGEASPPGDFFRILGGVSITF